MADRRGKRENGIGQTGYGKGCDLPVCDWAGVCVADSGDCGGVRAYEGESGSGTSDDGKDLEEPGKADRNSADECGRDTRIFAGVSKFEESAEDRSSGTVGVGRFNGRRTVVRPIGQIGQIGRFGLVLLDCGSASSAG